MAAPTLSVPFPAISTSTVLDNLVRCYFSDEHCDCRETATVHHLSSEQEFCLRHFKAVTRG